MWLVTSIGYFVLLVEYPVLGIKASHGLHVYPLIAILGAAGLERVGHRAPGALRALRVLLVLAALHNVPMFITSYPWRPAGLTEIVERANL